MKKGKLLNFISIIIALVSILIYSIELLKNLPETETAPTALNITRKQSKKLNPKCCIVTEFSRADINNLLLLGFTLKNQGTNPPKAFALSKERSLSANEKESIEKYFVLSTSEQNSNDRKYRKEWISSSLSDCFPAIYVSPYGVFNKSPWNICDFVFNKTLPAAVPKNEDILAAGHELFVFDPKEDVDEKYWQTPSTYISSFKEWTPLPADFSVTDFENEFLDFWMRYGNPTYITYSPETYQNILANAKNPADGSFRIYRLLKTIYAEYAKYNSK